MADVENMPGSDPARSPEGSVMAHTPGPWSVNGRRIEAMGGRGMRYALPICTSFDDPQTREQEEANVRLIAAAPDLLEALRWLLRVEAVKDDDDAELISARNAARAAIAKAEGKE